MIQINLLPGSQKKGGARRRRSAAVPAFRLPALNGGWTVFAAVAWLAGPALIGWLFLGDRARASELRVGIEAAQRDSALFARELEANQALYARRDTIAQKLEIIQQIDAGRYIWAHIVDEIARSVPDYTWLRNIAYVSNGASLDSPRFSITGRTGNTFALTSFMQRLEESPFVRNVRLITTTQVTEQEKILYSFVLEADYQPPAPDAIETVPLFGPAGEE
ncbi:MAG TPA: PilN domain-containing protein [Longimicrobiales bacterium]|nr:PilN domain-containing protein [Longimicrobiales bacterium]